MLPSARRSRQEKPRRGGAPAAPATTGGASRRRRRGRRRHRRARSRLGRHRRDHELHEHVEPERDDRRRPAREEGRRARPDAQAVGEDEPRARARRSSPTICKRGRPDAVPRRSSASISSATAARPASATAVRCPSRCRGDRRGQEPGRRVGAERQPQLRRPHPVSRCARTTSRRRRSSSPTRSPARWTIDLTTEPLGDGTRRRSRSTCATSGRPSARSRRRCCSAVTPEMFREQYADVFDGDERWQHAAGADGRPLRVGRRLDLHPQPAVLRGHDAGAGAADATSRGARVLALLGDSVTTDHISPAGSITTDSPAGKYLIAHGVRAARLQLLRRAPRQPRSDDARHVRQHPPAQPARARHRRRLDDATCPAAT